MRIMFLIMNFSGGPNIPPPPAHVVYSMIIWWLAVLHIGASDDGNSEFVDAVVDDISQEPVDGNKYKITNLDKTYFRSNLIF